MKINKLLSNLEINNRIKLGGSMTIVYLSLGSNIGDKVGFLQQAVKYLENDVFKIIRTSTLYETEPWGNKEQDWFINAVIEAKTKLSPTQLLHHCQQIEQELGRVREGVPRWGERTIDIDILFYGKEVINLPELTIPHPRMHQRAFVLVPMLELVPLLKHPILNKSIEDLHQDLQAPEDVFLYGTLGV